MEKIKVKVIAKYGRNTDFDGQVGFIHAYTNLDCKFPHAIVILESGQFVAFELDEIRAINTLNP